MTIKNNIPKDNPNYRWVVMAVCFIIFTVAFSIQFSFGIFFKPLQETFGWSRATTSWAITIHMTVYALFMVPAGWAIDHIKPRTLFSAAAFLIGLSLIMSSRISEAWQLYILYGLPLGVAISICGPVTIFPVISRWFTQERGLALGIASCGVGFGTIIGALISNWLIGSYGWANAFFIIGIASFVIIFVCAFFVKMPPNAYGEANAKAQTDRNKPTSIPIKGTTLKQALKTKELYYIMVMSGTAFFAFRIVMVHIAPFAIDVGISAYVAALAVGSIGGFSILGRLVMGRVQDRKGPQHAMLICLTLQGLTMIALPYIRIDILFFAFALIFGFVYGGDVPQTPALILQCFGVEALGVIYGAVLTVGSLIGAFGPIVAGYVFDATGSYTWIFLAAGVGLFIGDICIWKIRPPNAES